MSRVHGAEHEELLAALLSGEADPAELRQRLEGCEECARRLEELAPVADLLDLVGDGEGPVTSSLPAFPAGEEAARRRLLELAAAEERPAETGRRTRGALILVGLLAAAALALLVLRLLVSDGAEQKEEDIYVGTELEFLAPSAESVPAAALSFTWTGELATGETFVLRVRDEEGDDLLEPPLVLEVPRWRPDPELVADWPDRVHAQVVQLDEYGDDVSHSEWKPVRIER